MFLWSAGGLLKLASLTLAMLSYTSSTHAGITELTLPHGVSHPPVGWPGLVPVAEAGAPGSKQKPVTSLEV